MTVLLRKAAPRHPGRELGQWRDKALL